MYVRTYVRTYVLTSQGALWFVLLLCCISCRYHPVSSLRAFTVCQNWQTEINWIVHKWNDVLLLPNWESCLWSNCSFSHSKVSLVWGRSQCCRRDVPCICRLACLARQVLTLAKICGLTERESGPIRVIKLFSRWELSRTNQDSHCVALLRMHFSQDGWWYRKEMSN